MKYLSLIFFVFIIFSCGKNDCDAACDPVLPPVNFKIVNASGQNLVSGPNKIYSLIQINIRSFVGGTLTTDSLSFNGDTTLAATPLVFTATSNKPQYFLYINNIKRDSFQVSYQIKDGKAECCPQFTAITELKLNNVVTSYISPGNNTPVNVVK